MANRPSTFVFFKPLIYMIIVWLFVLRWQKMVWKIYREVWKNEDFWVKNSTFHNRCHDNKGLIVSTPPVWLHYTIKTCVIGMPVTMCFFSFRYICGVSAGVSPSSFHTSRTLPTPTMSSPASPRPPSCGGSCLWVREREREREGVILRIMIVFKRFFQHWMGILFWILFFTT